MVNIGDMMERWTNCLYRYFLLDIPLHFHISWIHIYKLFFCPYAFLHFHSSFVCRSTLHRVIRTGQERYSVINICWPIYYFPPHISCCVLSRSACAVLVFDHLYCVHTWMLESCITFFSLVKQKNFKVKKLFRSWKKKKEQFVYLDS